MPHARIAAVLLLISAPGVRTEGQAVVTAADCVANSNRLLGAFVGDYDVQAVYRAGPARWDSATARSRFAWQLGGCVLAEHFDGRRYGEQYEYVSLMGASGDSAHPIQRVFAHSQHGLLSISAGEWDATGDTLVIADSAFVRGRWIYQRDVMSRPRAGTFVSEGRRSEDGGRTWIVTDRARYARVAAPRHL